MLAWIEKKVVDTFVKPSVPKVEVLAVAADPASLTETLQGGAFDHGEWDAALHATVLRGEKEGIELSVVDYAQLAGDERVTRYRQRLAECEANALAPNEQLALYVNAYNCFCVGLITAHRQETGALPESIRKLGQGKTQVWDVPAGTIGGKEFTLNQIEHKVLRAKWREPRVHACIVCASISCPDLRAEAFVAPRLNAQMDDQCRTWLANERKGIAAGGAALTVSRIFLWFHEDFEGVAGTVPKWLARFAAGEAGELLGAAKTPGLRYFEYNWNLNAK